MPKQIYALCDWSSLQKKQISLTKFLEICSMLPISYIQYRDKVSPFETQKKHLIYLKNNTNIPIIINDKLELLEFVDGLHLGQEDLDIICNNKNILSRDLCIKNLRMEYKNKIFGLSTHNKEEILESNEYDLDYIGLGAYRNTKTKKITKIIGADVSSLAKLSKHPVGIIGGVKLDDEIENIAYYVIGSDLLS